MAREVVVGIDAGSASTKVAFSDIETGDAVVERRVKLNWSADDLLVTASTRTNVTALLATLTTSAHNADVRVVAIEIASVAESSVLLGPTGEDATAPIAWHDSRGEIKLRRLLGTDMDAFPAITGLGVTALPTIAKLAWLRSLGFDQAGHTWLSLGEYLAYRLTDIPRVSTHAGVADRAARPRHARDEPVHRATPGDG